MARLVLAIGTSHSPALNSPAEDYAEHATRDRERWKALDKDGRPCTYADLLAAADPRIRDEIRPEVIARRVEVCNRAMAKLAETLQSTKLDALIVVGDDQREQYHDDNMPSILVYWGDTIRNDVLKLPSDAPAYWRRARQQFHEIDRPRDYPVSSALGRHIIETLMDGDFDVSHSHALARDHGEGHAFGFVHRRLMDGMANPVPIVPVVLNTYFPPNQPRPRRCYALGRAIANAVESWHGGARVGIVASGGLSHFTVDEALDRAVLDACRRKDEAALGTIPVNKLNSGNSEIRNWITVAGAAEGLETRWQDYQPCYRSPAGTGCGMAFAIWT
jgi:3-O-methylgallate 3,4-dioxygenase